MKESDQPVPSFVHSMCLCGFIKIRCWFTASRWRLLSDAYFGTSSDRLWPVTAGRREHDRPSTPVDSLLPVMKGSNVEAPM